MAIELLVRLDSIRGSVVEHEFETILLVRLKFALEIETQEMESHQNTHGRKEFEEEFDTKLLDFLTIDKVSVLFRAAS